MTTTNLDYQSYFKQDLSTHFTADAWKQFSSYLKTLLQELNDYQVSRDEINLTFKGIEEYVLGYSQELSKDSKITFRQALSLMEEIGTPSEILEDHYVSSIKSTPANETRKNITRHCTECGAGLTENTVYCNYCGRNTRVEDRDFSPRKQWMIDHPYSAGMLIAIGIAGIIGVIGMILIAIGISRGYEISISADFGFILLMGLFLTAIGLTIGWYFNSTYGEYISFNERYERLKSQFENAAIGGHFTVVITIFVYTMAGILHRNALVGSPEGNISAFFVLLLLPLYLALASSGTGPTADIVPYYELLLLKTKVKRRLWAKQVDLNKKLIMPLIIIGFIWHFFIYQQLALESAYFAVPGYAISVFLLAIANGLFYAYQYSWSRVLSLQSEIQS